jgi:cell division protein FtsW
MEQKSGHIDWFILIPVAGLMLFSIAFVYSASAYVSSLKFGSAESLFLNHSTKVVFGLILIIIFAKIDYHFWFRHSKKILMLTIIPLILVFFIGEDYGKGALRWIDLKVFNFQPSELAKWALILHIATLLTLKQKSIKTFQDGMLPVLIWTFIVVVMIALQPNFSNAFIIFLISMLMLFVGNSNLLHLGSIAFISFFGAAIYAVSAQYRLQRIYSYIGRLIDDSVRTNEASSFQAIQAIIAFGSGGVFGVGPGKSQQSHLFLPESYGDYIFSIIGEEYGYFGVAIILLVFIFIFWRGMIIARNAPDNYGYFLAIGIILTLAIYVFVNTGVNCGILPATGVPLPLISYGGTAVFFYSMAIGILLNISAQAGVYSVEEEEEE